MTTSEDERRTYAFEINDTPRQPETTIEAVTTFSADALQAACERLRVGDPLHNALARLGGDELQDCRLPRPRHFTSPGFVRRFRASLVVVLLYMGLAVVPGFMITALGDRVTDQDFIGFTDGRELPGALFLYLVLAPVIWTLYLWQPRLIVDVFNGLAEGGVVGPPRSDRLTADRLLARLAHSLPRSRSIGPLPLTYGGFLALMAVAASLATLLVWPPTAVPPLNRVIPESELFWWRIVPVYFWVVWLPLVFVNVYMLVWIVLRQTIMIANIQRLLRLFVVEPVPFHPDRSSGFAPIGSYATNIVRVAVIVGVWALVLLLSGLLTGHGLYVAPHILFLVAVQVLLTPYLLFGPVWYAHRVMREARERAMATIEAEIRRDLLQDVSRTPEGWRQDTGDYHELEARYRLTEEGYHVWPFRRSAFGGVSVTAGLTLVANIVAILYRTYGR
jgi:hypothetical protein